jgi:hypothetical protein
MGISRQAAFDAASLAEKEGVQYADQGLSNAWLSSFTQAVDFGAGLLKGWNPASGTSSGTTSVSPGGPQGDESGISYYGY